MTKHIRNTIVGSLGAALFGPLLGLGAALQPAQAQPVTSSVSVASSDLDLTSAAGAATLKHRINRAVSEVCGTAETRDLQALADHDRCRKAATAGAMAQVQQRVAAAHRNGEFAAGTPR